MDSRLIKKRYLPKPLLLKDYLLDDMSSCSSNGFKSFPRRQCCSTAGFLHEFERKSKLQQKQKQKQKLCLNLKKPASRSALQSVITAVKRLPFSTTKSPERKESNYLLLPRSFYNKIFKNGNFWKRKSDSKEIVPWKTFDQLLKEDAEPSDSSGSSITTRDGKSNSLWGSHFTASDGGNSSTEVNLNLPKTINDVVKMSMEVVSDNGVGVMNGDVSTDSTTSSDGSGYTDSSTITKKQWSSEEKEQFSPVSVLDCPLDYEDDLSSPFRHRLARMEGTKKKLLKKIERFEFLAKLEPVDLTRRFAMQKDSDNEFSDSLLPHSMASTDEKFASDIDELEEEAEEEDDDDDEDKEETLRLLHQMKASMPSHAIKLRADKLLLDFFREKMTFEYANPEKQCGESPFHEGLLQEAEGWLNGRTHNDQSYKGWEVEKNRQAYVKDMEKGGEWKTLDQETQEVALELETEIFSSLLNELMQDILPEVTI